MERVWTLQPFFDRDFPIFSSHHKLVNFKNVVVDSLIYHAEQGSATVPGGGKLFVSLHRMKRVIDPSRDLLLL